jgi:hypothetical protein
LPQAHDLVNGYALLRLQGNRKPLPFFGFHVICLKKGDFGGNYGLGAVSSGLLPISQKYSLKTQTLKTFPVLSEIGLGLEGNVSDGSPSKHLPHHSGPLPLHIGFKLPNTPSPPIQKKRLISKRR